MSNGESIGSPQSNTQSTGPTIQSNTTRPNAVSGTSNLAGQVIPIGQPPAHFNSGSRPGQVQSIRPHQRSQSPQPSQRASSVAPPSAPGSPNPAGGSGRLNPSRLDDIVNECRSGGMSKSQSIARILAILDASTSSEPEKEKTLDLLLSELSAIDGGLNGPRARQAPANANNIPRAADIKGSKRIRNQETEDFLEQISKGSDVSLSGSDDDEGITTKRRRLKESDMPWYSSPPAASHSSNPLCEKTRQLLKRYNRDISNAKFYIRISQGSPEGIPSTQWERILRGEPVDLDYLLSALHRVTIDEERKGRLGSTEIAFGVPDAKKKVTTSAEWSSAWRRASKAITFCFPHRRDELDQYAEYIEGEFAAKHVSAHPRIIAYDLAIRNEIGGGQNHLLTEFHRFSRLFSAIVASDGVEYNSSNGKRSGKDKPNRASGSKPPETCNNFNTPSGCKFTERECRYKHICKSCGKSGHPSHKCPTSTKE